VILPQMSARLGLRQGPVWLSAERAVTDDPAQWSISMKNYLAFLLLQRYWIVGLERGPCSAGSFGTLRLAGPLVLRSAAGR
jgi:hypothetical protein